MDQAQAALKLRNTLYIFSFLLFALVLWAGLNMANATENTNISDEGREVIDLTLRDLKNTVYYSDGGTKNAQSFPERLLTPEDFESVNTGSPSKLTLKDYQKYQYITHRLRFKLPAGEVYGISMKSCDFSMRLFINGKETDCVGLPGVSKGASVPRVADRTYYFTPEGETVDIIIQTSNFVHKEGCYPPVFTIGTQQNITRTERSNWFISSVIIGSLLMSFLYHLALFLLNRSRKPVLIFSVCCFLLMIMSGHMLVPMFFSDYNWFWALRLEYIVHFLTFAMFVFFLCTIYPSLLNKVIARSYFVLSGIYVLSTFVFDSSVYSSLLIYYELASVVMIIYVLVRLSMALRGGKLQNLLSFIGIFVICLFGVNDILFHNNIVLFGRFAGQAFGTPIGMVFFVICYALVLSLDIAETERRMLCAERQVMEIQERVNALMTANAAAEVTTTKTIELTDFGLSKRESDVAWLLIDGKPRKEVAELLGLSIGTVNTYCQRIYSKTQSGSVAELCKRLGILQIEK